jgi:predicted RNA-binding Zn-ribbon protein involved in translation (DUF1610 family)
MVTIRKTSTKYFEASVDENCPHCGGSVVQLIIKESDSGDLLDFWYQCHECAEESDTFDGPSVSTPDLESKAQKTAEYAVSEHPWTA